MFKRQKQAPGTLGAVLLTAFLTASAVLTGCGAAASDTGSTVVRAAAAQADAAQLQAVSDTVSVTGKGSVYAEPDLAELRFGIRTQAEEAGEAQKANNKNVDAVLSALRQNGIREENIQTIWYDVSPQYDWNTGNGDTITGYFVNTTLTVKDVAIEDAGKLITVCTEAGANEFSGLSYSCSEYDRLYSEAQKIAVETSREKAEVLARAAGRSLGAVKAVSEGWQDTTYEANRKTMAVTATESSYDAGAGASLMPGQAEITANVTVTYELK